MRKQNLHRLKSVATDYGLKPVAQNEDRRPHTPALEFLDEQEFSACYQLSPDLLCKPISSNIIGLE